MFTGVRHRTQIIHRTYSLWGFSAVGRQAELGSRAGKAGSGSRRKSFRGGAQVHSLNRIQFRKVNTQVTSQRILGVFHAVRKEQHVQRWWTEVITNDSAYLKWRSVWVWEKVRAIYRVQIRSTSVCHFRGFEFCTWEPRKHWNFRREVGVWRKTPWRQGFSWGWYKWSQ